MADDLGEPINQFRSLGATLEALGKAMQDPTTPISELDKKASSAGLILRFALTLDDEQEPTK